MWIEHSAFRIAHFAFDIGHVPSASLGHYASLSFVVIGMTNNVYGVDR